MIKKIYKYLLSIPVLLGSLVTVGAISIQVPLPHGQEDIIITGPTQIQSNERTIFNIIEIINNYLWFFIGLGAMVVLVVGGIKLITANGNKDAMSSANKMIISAIIAILVSIFSYALVRLLVNLF